MTVTLIMLLWLTIGQEPQIANVNVDPPDLNACMDYAKKFLESDTAKQGAAASAGCTVKFEGRPS